MNEWIDGWRALNLLIDVPGARLTVAGVGFMFLLNPRIAGAFIMGVALLHMVLK